MEMGGGEERRTVGPHPTLDHPNDEVYSRKGLWATTHPFLDLTPCLRLIISTCANYLGTLEPLQFDIP
jgi:hypothetical protein